MQVLPGTTLDLLQEFEWSHLDQHRLKKKNPFSELESVANYMYVASFAILLGALPSRAHQERYSGMADDLARHVSILGGTRSR